MVLCSFFVQFFGLEEGISAMLASTEKIARSGERIDRMEFREGGIGGGGAIGGWLLGGRVAAENGNQNALPAKPA